MVVRTVVVVMAIEGAGGCLQCWFDGEAEVCPPSFIEPTEALGAKDLPRNLQQAPFAGGLHSC
jgi:hypothetical protein